MIKFKINQKVFVKGLEIASKAITGSASIPILDGVLVNIKETQLELTGCDTDITIKTIVGLEDETEHIGSFVIDHKILKEICKRLSGDILCTVENNLMHLECNKSIFDLICIQDNVGEYPKLPEIKADDIIELPQKDFKDMIQAVSYAASLDDTRPILKGINIEVEDSVMSATALDGYRLAHKEYALDKDYADTSAVIDAKALNEIVRLLENSNTNSIKLVITRNHIAFRFGNTFVTSRLLEGQFVNYRKLIPSESDTVLNVSTLDFKESIERTIVLADKNTSLVKLNLSDDSDKLIITSDSHLGKVEDIIDAKYLKGNKNLTIAFNSRFLIDALRGVSDEDVMLNIVSAVSPCTLRKQNSNEVHLILPIRIIK